MAAAGECIHKVAQCIVTALHWLNADLSAKLRMETRVSSHGIATLLLQHYLDKPRTWMPIAKLVLLPGATGETGELCPTEAEGTA